VPVGGLQGVRSHVVFPFVVGETCSKSWWKQAVPLHCGWMWPAIQFTGRHPSVHRFPSKNCVDFVEGDCVSSFCTEIPKQEWELGLSK